MTNEKTITDMMYEVKSYKMLAPGYRQRMKIVLEMLETDRSGRILEIGCGSGENTEILMKLGMKTTALEISREEIRATKERLGDKVNLVLCDIQRMPFKKESFEKILCASVLEHIPDDVKGTSEIRRVMKTGGIGVIGVPSEYTPFFRDPINFMLRKAGREPVKSLGGMAWGHYRHYTLAGIKDLLAKNRLRITEIEEISRSIVSLFHFYLPEIYTFVIRPRLKKRKGKKVGRKTYGSMFRSLSRVSEWISVMDRGLKGSSSGFCIKIKKSE